VDTAEELTLPVANPSPSLELICKGKVLGVMLDPFKCLSKESELSQEAREWFNHRAAFICTIVNGPLGKQDLNHSALDCLNDVNGLSQRQEANVPTGECPKTTEPGNTDEMKSKDLEELIDVDPSLTTNQHAKVYEVLRKHELAFGFDGCLGKHPTKVHIKLAPGTKPISSVPYITSPAKRELIDKQLDLWLSLGVIKPSNSPWGAPVLIVHQHSKDHLCMDWRKLNAIMEEGLGALMTDKSKSGSARLYVGGCISYLFNGLVQSDG
jgi:hypothetical protein